MSDEDWLEILDQIGASATRGELWEHMSRAPKPWSSDARELFQHLIDPRSLTPKECRK